VFCQGDNGKAQAKYRYLGLADCVVAQRLADGPRPARGMPGAGQLRTGLPVRGDRDDRRGAGGDQPGTVHRLPQVRGGLPPAGHPHGTAVRLSAGAVQQPRPGALVRKYCSIGCIACQICVKTAPTAIASRAARPGARRPARRSAAGRGPSVPPLHPRSEPRLPGGKSLRPVPA